MTPRVARLSICLAALGVTAITAVSIGLASYLGATSPAVGAAMFLAGALPTWFFLVDALGRASRAQVAAHPHPQTETRGAPLTLATWVTVGRGLLLALVAGFALGPLPAGPLRWLPGLLYALAALGDALDGAIARRMGQVTGTGAALDVSTDIVGLVVAPLVAVRWGQLPPWYLALAFAYPAFRAALALRRARGLPVFLDRLRPDPRARLAAGLQMAVVAAALLPVLPRAVAWTAATLAMAPTLALFAGEWLRATRSAPNGDEGAERLHA